ncbi:MAG: hypothetical protein PHG08_09520 [Bacilli bacterium]|jgi:hypothetical protein|nr:hypothetical protein [Bacilli bacterium]HHU24221.1 hypothetical protein [Acholeplasmataceae bacterium]
MEIVERILKAEKNIKHSLLLIKVLLLFSSDPENQRKLDYIERKYQDLQSTLMLYELKLNEINQDETEINALYNQSANDCETILNMLAEIKEDIFPRFKLASMIIIDNMNNETLENFYEELKRVLSDFNNIDEACDYLYYHTGDMLSNFITDLLAYIKAYAPERLLRLIPIAYFESKQTIITLSFVDWVQIFNNIRFTLKYVGNLEKTKYQALMEQYRKLEVFYFIIITSHSSSPIVVENK